MFDRQVPACLHRLDGLEIQNKGKRYLEDLLVEFHLRGNYHFVLLVFYLQGGVVTLLLVCRHIMEGGNLELSVLGLLQGVIEHLP